MADTYANWAELSANETEGVDYLLDYKDENTDFIVLAIHGGGIEGGTSEVLREVAKGHSYFLFEAIKSSGNQDLHLTSTHFDEPHALQLTGDSVFSLSLHGYSGDELNTKIGGGNRELVQKAYDELTAAGFNAEILPLDGGLAGTDPDNICNRTSEQGVQLEMSTGQRKALFGTFTMADRKNTQNATFYKYAQALTKIMG